MEVWRDPSGAQGLGLQPFQAWKSSGMRQQPLRNLGQVRGKLRHSPQHVTGRMAASGDILGVRIVFRHSNKVGGDSSGCAPAKGPRVPVTDQGQAPLGFYGRYPPAALPPRPVPWQRGGKAKVTLVGWLCSPWSQAGASQSPQCVCHTISPQNSECCRQTQGWPVDAAGWPGTCSGSYPGSAPPATWGHLGGTSPLQRSPCWSGHGCPLPLPPLVMGCAATALSPCKGEHLSPCFCTPYFVLCVPGMTPICHCCAVAPVSYLLSVPVQVPSDFPVTPVSPARLCHPVPYIPSVRSPLLEPRTFQCPFCAFCVSCACPVSPTSHMSPLCPMQTLTYAPSVCPARLQCVSLHPVCPH